MSESAVDVRTPATPRAQPGEALRFDRVTCSFRSNSGAGLYTAVRDASLSVDTGEFVSVVGPTGCGKSTLLNVAAGLLRPTSGTITAFGSSFAGLNRDAAYLFQGESLMPWGRAIDNIAVGLRFHGKSRAEALEIAQDWLDRVGLHSHGALFPHQMSGGMRKRVAIAQALALNPPIILMDEPFSALDIQTRQMMETELLDLWSQDRKSVLFITHDLEEAISLSDRVVVLSAGPGTHPIAEFTIDLPRPREVADIRLSPDFLRLHTAIWGVLKEEVLKGYAQGKR
ncbi:ABC transporter ATP-binding protein [Acidisphaera sp. L21]|jgi:NitT/TauT family transport system ATP-binding protein|uniref:ABC transporter ATP-binding protein n=1 Tax=Acidisphaera sp. L21 TaxID=1641851 RepID=UPI00131C199E|nr:ABC transporter ATP-binding protein [Acidisphaera sp. L21]